MWKHNIINTQENLKELSFWWSLICNSTAWKSLPGFSRHLKQLYGNIFDLQFVLVSGVQQIDSTLVLILVYIYPLFLEDSFPIKIVTECWVVFLVLCRRFLYCYYMMFLNIYFCDYSCKFCLLHWISNFKRGIWT